MQHDTTFGIHQISVEERVVNTRTLDSMNFDPVFMKVDVEGAEMSVLQGSIATLIASHPILLIEILSTEIYEEISAFLLQLGYCNLLPGFKRDEENAFYENTTFLPATRNYLWLHSEGSPNWQIRK